MNRIAMADIAGMWDGFEFYPSVEWSHYTAILPNVVTGKLTNLPEASIWWIYSAKILTVDKKLHEGGLPFHTKCVEALCKVRGQQNSIIFYFI